MTLPIDWNDWYKAWRAWEGEHLVRRAAPKFKPGKNMLADEILGCWHVPAGLVELSAVTMPDLSGEPGRRGERVRYIGITFSDDRTDLVDSFADLEKVLGLI